TGNTTQSRATYLFGPLCELAVTQGLLLPITTQPGFCHMSPSSFPAGTINTPYSQTISPGPPMLVGGSLPAGLSLNGNNLSGTPTTAGTFSFTLEGVPLRLLPLDRKSTRLNSSHRTISYAVF